MNRLADKLQNYHVILGSASPRRRELLAGLDIPFEVVVKDTNECVNKSLPLEQIPRSIAQQKFSAFLPELRESDLLITADTLVFCGKTIAGKPKSEDDAKALLKMLSGREHTVVTGVCVGTKQKQTSFYDVTTVEFETLSDAEIDYYIETYKPFDKAGAYGVQEWIGYVAIKKITGSYYNVMGLPVHRLYRTLLEFVEN